MLNLETLSALAARHADDLPARVREFSIGGEAFAFNTEPAIMGVINLSPDSWYRESVCLTVDSAIRRGRVLRAQGARIVDVGAESTLAQAAIADEALQKSRLLPVVNTLSGEGILVSAETYHPRAAKACLEAGAKVINWTGAEPGDDVLRMIAGHNAAIIICYVEGKNVREVGEFSLTGDPIQRMYEYFARETERCARCGLDRVFIDPGLGFYYRNLQDSAVRVQHQINTFLNTFRLRKLGFPVCHALPHAFEIFGDEVRSAEGFFAVLAALGKTDLFRTHEVPRVRAVLEAMK